MSIEWVEELLTTEDSSDYDFLERYEFDLLLKKHGYIQVPLAESDIESLSRDIQDELCR